MLPRGPRLARIVEECLPSQLVCDLHETAYRRQPERQRRGRQHLPEKRHECTRHPIVRVLQARFRRDSAKAMRGAVEAAAPGRVA